MSDIVAEINSKSLDQQVSSKESTGLFVGLFIAIVVIIAMFTASYHYLSSQRAAKEVDLANLQYTISQTRAEAIQTWLNGVIDSSRRLAGSDIFRLFSAEVNKLPEGIPLLFSDAKGDISDKGEDVEQLSSQLPLMQNLLSEFVKYSPDFEGARIMTSNGESYLSTDLMRSVTHDQIALCKETVKNNYITYGPLQISARGELLLDAYIPIYSGQDTITAPVAVLILSINARDKLFQVLSPGDYTQQGLMLDLVQFTGKDYQVFVPDMEAFYSLPNFDINEKNEFPFALRKKFTSNEKVYLYGYKVPTLNWWIIAEHKESIITDSFKSISKAVYAVTALLSLVLILGFVAAWWWLIGRRQGVINHEFQKLLLVIADQKKLLDGINSTITDPISLTDEHGNFVYVNNAFAHCVGRDEAACIGLDGTAVFGFDTAKRLNASDQHVLLSGEGITINEVLWLQSKRFYFQISKAPLKEKGSQSTKGIVSVFRDITQLVEAEKRSHRVVQQTIDALVSTIERADPFLGGHSRIMGKVASLVGKQLALEDSDIATIEAAANLSQVGKMFIPRNIVLKPSALNPEEKEEMEKHVEYAHSVLKNIEFDLPVLDAILQMSERLDGNGYPKGLTEEQISIHAKVLSVANAFTAMARPRSYRAALSLRDAIAILERDSGLAFDPHVIDALREVLTTPAGEKVVAQAAMTEISSLV